MELMLIGLGGCTAFDVLLILQKARQFVTDVEVELDADRADTVPAVFTAVRVHYKVYGRDLSEQQVARAISLSQEKYCSATRLFAATVDIHYTHEILAPV